MSAATAEPIGFEYVEGHGPGVVELPELTQADLPPAPGLQVEPEYPGWQLEHVNTFLMGLGSGIHMLIGQGEHDWEMTKADLERIGPPMCRIANRWQPALRASQYADPFMVAYGFALYGWRSALERARALKDQEAQLDTQPGAGYERTQAQQEPQEPASDELQTEDFEAVKPMFPASAVKRTK